MKLDEFDLRILRQLQEDADCSMADLGASIGLSHTPCWRRVKRLEAENIIRGKVVLLDPRKLNLGVTVYAYIIIRHHDEESLNAFESAVQRVDEIVECYSISGDKDYVLRVVVDSVEHYEQLLKTTIVRLDNVASVNSTFALKQVKYTTKLPL